jgi:uncharacterized protein
MKDRFLADSMLGRLAKWLRMLGYDTIYLRSHEKRATNFFQCHGERRLLTRRQGLVNHVPGCVFIESDHVGEQLCQMRKQGLIHPRLVNTTRLCSRCNTALLKSDPDSARDSVPEYIFFQHSGELLWCPMCKRHYWAGSHRDRMERHLRAWGVLDTQTEEP